MSVRVTLATARRVLEQLKGDHRTVALLMIAPREQMAGALEVISAVLPMTYAVDGMTELAHPFELSGDLLVVAGSAAAALALGAGTLRRRTA